MSRAVALTVLSRAIQLASAFAGTIVTARFLGPDQRGQYFFVVTLTLVIVQFANLGLQSSNTYYVARNHRLLGPLLANSIWASLVVGAAGAAAVVAVLHATGWFGATDPSLMWFAVAYAPAVLFFTLGTNLLVGIQRLGVFNLVEAAANLGVTAALVAAGVLGAGVAGFLATGVSAWCVIAVLLALYLWHVARSRLSFRRDVFATGFRYAAKAYIVTALGFLVLRGNVFVLQHFWGPRELGYYSVAAQIGDAMAVLPASVALVLFPRLVKEPGTRWSSTVRTTKIVAAMLAAACVLAAALAGPFVRIAFGAAFAPAAGVLRLLLPGVFALGVSTVLSQYLAAIGVPKMLVPIWGTTLAIVVGIGALLVPGHAGAGAAGALSVAYLALLLMVGALAYKHRNAGAEPPLEPIRLDTFDISEAHGGTA